ncbi:MAG TPA: PQQ-binding-like beta-propeller repeat protein [Planctomycetota bacterium]|jgi:outer membrane protein assembly factor BamB/tetratricopeptide (TPR) repeat protein|nr:PQQ-binding-like beta-propeller repeat protein [Planctomycetota bacterium]
MVFTGDLDSVELAQVFQVLHANSKTGMLLVFRTDGRRAFHFGEKGVGLQFDPPAYEERIVEQLRRRGKVSEESVRLSVANRRSHSNLVESLVAIRAVAPRDVEETLRFLLEEDLFETFFWRGARFEFFEGARRVEDLPGAVDERFVFHPDSVVMEAARRIDEWTAIRARIPDRSIVFAPIEGVEPPPESSVEAEVFAYVDCCRSVDEILRNCPRAPFDVEKTLLSLYDGGWIGPVEATQLLEAGRRALEAGRPREAAALLEQAAEAGVEPEVAWGKAAQAHRAGESFVSTVRCLRRLADERAARGQLGEACGALREAVSLLPTDLGSRERLVTLALGLAPRHRDGFDPVVEGRAVASLFLDLEQPDRARAVLEAVLTQTPKDAETKRLLVSALTRLGETSAVVSVYESLANDVAQTNPIGAVRYLQKILLLNRNRTDVAERIKKLYTSVERRRARRRGALVAVAAGIGLAAMAGLYALYETNARAAFEGLDLDGRRLRREYREAAGSLEDFLRRHPLSLTAGRAREALADVRVALDHEQIRHRSAEERAAAERAEQAARGEDLLRKAREKAGEGALREAGDLLRSALAEAPPGWSRGEDVRKQIASIDAYLAEGSELARRAEELEAAGRYAQARKAWLELLATRADAPEARTARLPFRIETDPPGARVLVEGATLEGTTPLVVRLEPGRAASLEIRLPGFLPAKRTVEPRSPDLKLVELYRAPTSVSKLPEPPSTAPVRAGRNLLVGLRGGKVVALDGADGRERWRATLAGFGEVSSLSVVGEEEAYFTGTDGTVACVRVSTGEPRFRVRTGGKVLSPPAVSGNLLVVGAGSALVALDRETGAERWRKNWGAAVSLPVLLFPEGFVAAGSDGRVRLLDARDGGFVREWKVPAAPIGVVRVDDRLLVLASGGQFVSLDPSAEGIQWTGPPLGLVRHPPVAGSSRIFVAAGEDLVAVDSETGRAIARRAIGFLASAPPEHVGDALLVAGDRTRVAAFDETTLERRWQTVLEEEVQAFSRAGDDVLVVTTGGTLLGFDSRATQPAEIPGR